MNIFVLDSSPYLAAQYHCDKHVVKMISESVQMLHAAMPKLPVPLIQLQPIVKLTHQHHPCTIWAGESYSNFCWLAELAYYLCKEKSMRWPHNREHQYAGWIRQLSVFLKHNLDVAPPTHFPIAITWSQCQGLNIPVADAVKLYRQYYCLDKQHIRKYTNQLTPKWFLTTKEISNVS